MIASVIAQLIEWFVSILVKLGLKEIKQIEDNKAIEDQAQRDRDQLIAAHSAKEKEDAASKLARDTFSS